MTANGGLRKLSNSACNLIFDLDGTLIDSISGIESSLAAAFLSMGRRMPDVPLQTVIGPPISMIARQLDPTLTDVEVAEIARFYRRSYDSEGWRQSLAFDGVAKTLHRLQQREARLFIVTNKPRLPSQQILAHLRLEAFFEVVLSRDSRDPAYIDKAEMLLGLMESRGLETHTTCMIGDTAEDEEAAAASGLPFIYASYGYGSVAAGPPAVQAFSELLVLLDSILTPKDMGLVREI